MLLTHIGFVSVSPLGEAVFNLPKSLQLISQLLSFEEVARDSRRPTAQQLSSSPHYLTEQRFFEEKLLFSQSDHASAV